MQTIAHYNLLERLGIGALGDVYRARDLKVGRTVALMMPPPELVSGGTRAHDVLGWTPARPALDDIVGDAWRFHAGRAQHA